MWESIRVLNVEVNKLNLIYPGVDHIKFNPSIKGDEVYEKYQMDGPVILFVGRLARRKNLFTLLRSMQIIINDHPDATLLIVGKGEKLKSILYEMARKQGIRKNVLFSDFIPERELPKYYACCNIFVMPSWHETLCHAILEAMATARPVVATKVGGVPEIVRDGENGFLVKPGDHIELASKILQLLEDEKVCREMGERGRAKILADHRWDKVANQTIKVYEKILC